MVIIKFPHSVDLITAKQNQFDTMINCPDFDTDIDNVQIIRIFNTLAFLSIIIHFYTMYCIVFRSSVEMKTYRWYLLWYQITAFCGDFWVNFPTYQFTKLL